MVRRSRLDGPPARWRTKTFTSLLQAEELAELRWLLENFPAQDYGAHRDRAAGICRRLPEWGERLRAAVLGPERLDEQGHGRVAARPRLVVASDDPSFLALPWELALADGVTGTVADVTRRPRSHGDEEIVIAGAKLRVLWVLARERSADDLAYGIVSSSVFQALRGTGLRIELIRPATLEQLSHCLDAGASAGHPYQILHLDTHGSGENGGTIGLEPTASSLAARLHPIGSARVNAQRLGAAFSGHAPPLVLLNACRSAPGGRAGTTESAVAIGLLAAGARAVVAMSHEIRGVTAARFMRVLYAELALGRMLGDAVATARTRLLEGEDGSQPRAPEWLIPVLYGSHRLRIAPERRPKPSMAGRPPTAEREEPEPIAPGSHATLAGMSNAALLEIDRLLGWNVERPVEAAALLLHGEIGVGKTHFVAQYLDWYRHTRVGALTTDWIDVPAGGLASTSVDAIRGAVGRMRATLQPNPGVERSRRGGAPTAILVVDGIERLGPTTRPSPSLPNTFAQLLIEALDAGVTPILLSRDRGAWLRCERLHRMPFPGLDRDAEDGALPGRLSAAANAAATPALDELWLRFSGHAGALHTLLAALERHSATEVVAAFEPAGCQSPSAWVVPLVAELLEPLRALRDEDRARLRWLAVVADPARARWLASFTARFPPQDTDAAGESDWAGSLERTAALGLTCRLNDDTYRIHPLLECALAVSAPDEPEKLAQVRGRFVDACCDLLESPPASGDGRVAGVDETIREHRMGLTRAFRIALATSQFDRAAVLLRALEISWERTGDSRPVETAITEAVEAVEATPEALRRDRDRRALWLVGSGARLRRAARSGRTNQAKAILQSLIAVVQAGTAEQQREELPVLHHLSHEYFRSLGLDDLAARSLLQAIRAFRQVRDPQGVAAAAHELGVQRLLEARPNRARRLFRRELQLLEDHGGPAERVRCHAELARVASVMADHEGARKWDNLARHGGNGLDRSARFRSLLYQALVHCEQAKTTGEPSALEAAVKHARAAAEGAEAIGDTALQGDAFRILGRIAEVSGDHEEALRWYSRALPLCDRLGVRLTTGLLHAARARALQNLDDPDQPDRRRGP